MTIYGQITANQPTVPTVGNSSTTYTQTFGGSTTSINYGFYLFGAPSCASLASAACTFRSAPPLPSSTTATSVQRTSVLAATSVLSTAPNASGSITAQCTNGDAYKIALNGGATAPAGARWPPVPVRETSSTRRLWRRAGADASP